MSALYSLGTLTAIVELIDDCVMVYLASLRPDFVLWIDRVLDIASKTGRPCPLKAIPYFPQMLRVGVIHGLNGVVWVDARLVGEW
jgi:hypothetical protein